MRRAGHKEPGQSLVRLSARGCLQQDRRCQYITWWVKLVTATVRNDPSRSVVQRPIPAQAGIGLRPMHHSQVLAENPAVPWFEVHAENFMTHGSLADDLRRIAKRYPLSMHAVGLSLGSVRLPERSHLKRLVALNAEFAPDIVSDHLSWSATDTLALPDLFPLPYSEESLAVTVRNVDYVQNILGRTILIENPSSYLSLVSSTMSEAEFLEQLVARTDCGVLLDVNNIYVSALNRDSDPRSALDDLLDRIAARHFGEIHLAGHAEMVDELGNFIRVDDHGSPVRDDVWTLFEAAIRNIGPLPTLIEWDTGIPPFNRLCAEAATAQSVLDRYALAGPRYADAC
jgi:uncharacterized protein